MFTTGGGAGGRDSQKDKQYDLTDWLVLEMVDNANSSTAEAIEQYTDISKSGLIGTSYAGLKAGQLYLFNAVLTGHKVWDIKREIEIRVAPGVILCGESECGWFDYSTVGNIHYGYIAAKTGAANFTLSTIAGGYVEVKEGTAKWGNRSNLFEDPDDSNAVAFGYYLYETYGDDLTVTEFQQALSTDIMDGFQKIDPKLGFAPPFNATAQDNYSYPLGYFDCLAPECSP